MERDVTVELFSSGVTSWDGGVSTGTSKKKKNSGWIALKFCADKSWPPEGS